MNAQTRSLLWWVGGIIGTIGLIVLLANLGSSPSSETTTAALTITDTDHILGEATAPVTVVEYSDFQCPACGYYYPILKDAESALGNQARFVYRHYPLRQAHPNAQIAAQASEAASNQGKFWEMHNILFERQSTWSTAGDVQVTLKSYAKELGLNEKTFADDLNSSGVKDRIERDVATGNQIRLAGTPTVYINGVQLNTPFTKDELVSAVQAAAK